MCVHGKKAFAHMLPSEIQKHWLILAQMVFKGEKVNHKFIKTSPENNQLKINEAQPRTPAHYVMFLKFLALKNIIT